MAKNQRSFSDLQLQLERQLNFLDRSCLLFDDGYEDEAVRISTTIRILLRDTKNSKSLLSQLGIKEKLNFVDTGVYLADWKAAMKAEGLIGAAPSFSDTGLLLLGHDMEGKPGWFAPLDEPKYFAGHPAAAAIKSPREFDFWWTTPLVRGMSTMFSRCELISIMCDQDGGAHVDPKIDKDYADLTFWNLGLSFAEGNQTLATGSTDFTPVNSNIAAESVRQIAYELMTTLENYFEEESKGSAPEKADS